MCPQERKIDLRNIESNNKELCWEKVKAIYSNIFHHSLSTQSLMNCHTFILLSAASIVQEGEG